MAFSPIGADGGPRAVLLDAHGTLVELDDPVARLTGLLARAGAPFAPSRVEAAFRAEVAHYRRHYLDGRDASSLEALRARCARVFAEALGPGAPAAPVAQRVLSEGVFRLLPGARGALECLAGAGFRLAVVSNWDCSLDRTLADLGVARFFAAVVTSARVGVEKPDPAVFRAALEAVGVAPGRAVMCGDDPVRDGEGALAVGIRPVLVGVAPAGGAARRFAWIGSVADLCPLLGAGGAPSAGHGREAQEGGEGLLELG
ncbi:MAG TPA: HAD-IA family hydrolase [Miltoncostaeaceae bacterium]|nr:HAD-IA family hydrolase [Miltoncostaeaceae bacterium]